MPSYLALIVAIAAEVTATTALKSAEGFTRLIPSVIAIVGYCASFYLLSLALRSIPVGMAYAIWSGVGTAIVVLLAWLIHGQRLDVYAQLGVVLITAGVLVLNLVSDSAKH